MKKTTGLLFMLVLLLASCNSPNPNQENKNGNSRSVGGPPLVPLDVFVFIDGGDAKPIENVRVVATAENNSTESAETNACGMANLKLDTKYKYIFDVEAEEFKPLQVKDVVVTEIMKFSLTK